MTFQNHSIDTLREINTHRARQVCKSLITLGADFTLRDMEDQDPHSLALGLGLQECGMALREMATDLNLTRFECCPTNIPGVGECLLAIRGPVVGNVYSPEVSRERLVFCC